MTEKQFQAEVIDIAKQIGWLLYHTYDSRRCEPGFPGLVLVRDRVMFRELKTKKGKLTLAQIDWGRKLQASGADYAVWRPSNMREVIKTLQRKEM